MGTTLRAAAAAVWLSPLMFTLIPLLALFLGESAGWLTPHQKCSSCILLQNPARSRTPNSSLCCRGHANRRNSTTAAKIAASTPSLPLLDVKVPQAAVVFLLDAVNPYRPPQTACANHVFLPAVASFLAGVVGLSIDIIVVTADQLRRQRGRIEALSIEGGQLEVCTAPL